MWKRYLLGEEQTFTNKIYCPVYFDACSTDYLVTCHKHGRTLPPHRSVKHEQIGKSGDVANSVMFVLGGVMKDKLIKKSAATISLS